MSKSQHVVPNRDGAWAVRRSGALRASRLFTTQQDALQYARQVAQKEGSGLYLHRGDGTVTVKETYNANRVPNQVMR